MGIEVNFYFQLHFSLLNRLFRTIILDEIYIWIVEYFIILSSPIGFRLDLGFFFQHWYDYDISK